MATVQSLDPFGKIESLEVDWSEIVLPGNAIGDVVHRLDPEFGDPYVDLADVSEWDAVRVPLSGRIDPKEVGNLLKDKKTLSAISVMACKWCPATKLRRATPVHVNRDGSWSGEVIIERAEVYDNVGVFVRVLRNAPGLNDVDGQGYFHGALLAESPVLNIYIDAISRPVDSQIRWQWIDFESHNDDFLRKKKSELFYVDAGTPPTVYLNSSVRDLQQVLNDKGRRNATAVTRLSFESAIATMAYFQLLVTAISTLRRSEEGDGIEVESSWKGSLSRRVASELFGADSSSSEESLEALLNALDDPGQRAQVYARLSVLSQNFGQAGKRFLETSGICTQLALEEGKESP